MTSQANIKQLLARCKKQDWAAQKELYLLFADDMMSIAIRYASALAPAKDLVQETFIIFFNKIDQYDDSRGSLGAWLRRILINKSYEHYRKNKKRISENEDKLVDQVSNETSILEKLEAEDILKLLHALPEGCRIIFNLNVIEGYSHIEIGEMLGITSGGSRSQLSRAKKLLRNMINESASYRNYINQD